MSSACNKCKKTGPGVTLKRCAKCSITPYCSRDCQKSDWKIHRKTCGKTGSAGVFTSTTSTAGSDLSPPKGLEQPISKPFSRLCNNNWLHDRPEKDVYRLLIDAYRLRVEDEYSIEQNNAADSLYSGAPDGLRGFQKFLDRASSRPGILPSWWSDEKRAECEQLGMDTAEWQDLRCAIEKSDVIEHYGDPKFPMQLRMFAEVVIGRGLGGANGKSMMNLMASMEKDSSGDGLVSTIDLSQAAA